MTDVASGDVNQEPVVPQKEVVGDQVAYSSYKKVLDQRKADNARLKETQEQLNTLLAEKASEDEAKLAEQGKFKELLEAEQLKSQQATEQLQAFKEQGVIRSKEEALRKEIGQLKNPDYLKFADISNISMDADGKIDTESVKQVALNFKDSYPDLLQGDSNNLPNSAPGKASGGLTYEKWLSLPSREQKARMSEVID